MTVMSGYPPRRGRRGVGDRTLTFGGGADSDAPRGRPSDLPPGPSPRPVFDLGRRHLTSVIRKSWEYYERYVMIPFPTSVKSISDRPVIFYFTYHVFIASSANS